MEDVSEDGPLKGHELSAVLVCPNCESEAWVVVIGEGFDLETAPKWAEIALECAACGAYLMTDKSRLH